MFMGSEVDIVETAGFVDIETRFKRLEQSGYVAHFFREMFDTSDEREIYLGEDTQIYGDDDEETVNKKLYLQEMKKQEIIKSRLGDLAETNDEEGRQDDRGSSESKSPSQRSSAESVQNTNDTDE